MWHISCIWNQRDSSFLSLTGHSCLLPSHFGQVFQPLRMSPTSAKTLSKLQIAQSTCKLDITCSIPSQSFATSSWCPFIGSCLEKNSKVSTESMKNMAGEDPSIWSSSTLFQDVLLSLTLFAPTAFSRKITGNSSPIWQFFTDVSAGFTILAPAFNNTPFWISLLVRHLKTYSGLIWHLWSSTLYSAQSTRESSQLTMVPATFTPIINSTKGIWRELIFDCGFHFEYNL